MSDIHIVSMLEEKAFSGLSGAEIANAEAHIAICRDCKSAYDAARIAAVLIEVRTAETIEVEPFFKTRVMALIREKRSALEEPVLVRMWRAAGAMVSTMAVLLVILTGITIFSPGPGSRIPPIEVVVSQNIYSPEYVMLDRGDVDDEELAANQVIPTMYDLEDSDGQ